MEYAQNTCGFGLMAVSLGYFDTLLSMSGSTTSSELNESEKESAGSRHTYPPFASALLSALLLHHCVENQQALLPCSQYDDALPVRRAKRSGGGSDMPVTRLDTWQKNVQRQDV